MSDPLTQQTTRRRTLQYGGLALSLALLSLPLSRSTWQSSIHFHTIMESIATTLAVTVGVMALLRFYSKKSNTLLFLGTGFLGAGFLDGYHTIVTSEHFILRFTSPPSALIPWSWIASRLFLAILLWLSWLAWRREVRLGERGRIPERTVFWLVGGWTMACFLFFAVAPLPPAYFPGLPFPRPEEFIPGLFFLLALSGYWRKGHWKEDPVEHWLMLALIINVMDQTAFMSRSHQLYDTMFDLAHLLKKLSYVCVLTGLSLSMYALFRREEKFTVALEQRVTERTAQLQIAVRNMEEEMVARKRTEESLQESEEKARAISESASDAIIMIDQDGLTRYWNATAQQIFGYSAKEIMGREAHPLLAPAHYRPAYTAGFKHFQETGHGPAIGKRLELAALRRDGTEFPIEITVGAFKLGGQWNAVAVIRDITERKRAENELLETTQALQSLIQASPISIVVLDCEGKIRQWNPASERIFGWCKQDVLGRLLPTIPPDKQEEHRAFRERVLNDNAFTDLEVRRLKKDGALIDISLSTAPLRNAGGNIVGILGLMADITERKRAEETIRENAKRIHAIFDQAPLGIAVINSQTGQFVEINEKYCEITGFAAKEMLNSTFMDITYPEDLQLDLDNMKHLLEGRVQSFGMDKRYIRKDGSLRWVHLTVVPLWWGVETPRYHIAMVEDITERKQVEDELRLSVEYARTLIEANPDPITIISLEGEIKDVNMSMEAASGVSRERLIGSDFAEYFTDPEKAKAGYHQVLSQGAIRDYPLTIRHASGRLMDVLYNAAVYCNKAGEVQGVLAAAHDITEHKRMLAQAARMERLAALGQLLGGIAHELKNPLFIVTGRIQLLKERLANREYDEAGKDVPSIEEACKRMTEITQRFLSTARPVPPQWQKCWVHDVLTQTLDFLANELMKDRILVVRAFAPNIPQVWSEPRLLYEVFLNLILNAVQAMVLAHGQGTLTVTTDRNDDSIVIRIQDDGPGIPPQHRARLFEPFFSTKPTGQGTGLGLWTVRSTLATLNGTVECESEEGKGAIFIVSIPIVSYPPKE